MNSTRAAIYLVAAVGGGGMANMLHYAVSPAIPGGGIGGLLGAAVGCAIAFVIIRLTADKP